MNRFYVYMIYKTDNTPIYVGKGTGTRAYNSFRRSDNKAVRACTTKDRFEIVRDNLTESEAFKFEVELIQRYGRRSEGTGVLYNLTPGGDGVSGHVYSESEIVKRYPNRRPVHVEHVHTGELQSFISLGAAARGLSVFEDKPITSTGVHELVHGKVKVLRGKWKMVGADVVYDHSVKERAIGLKDITTGEIFHFKSASAASRYTGVSKDLLCSLRKGRFMVTGKRWSLADTSDVDIESRFKNKIINYKNTKETVVFDTHTNEVLTFRTRREAALSLGCSRGDVGLLVSGVIKSTGRGRYTLPGNVDRVACRHISILDTSTNTVTVYYSGCEASKAIQMHESSISALACGRVHTLKRGRYKLSTESVNV